MSESNPISPKVLPAIPIGGILGTLGLALADTLVSLVAGGSFTGLPEPWETIVWLSGAGVGAVLAAYRTNDPRRIKGEFSDESLRKLNEPDPLD